MLVSGATGRVGSAVVVELAAAGYRVRGMTRDVPAARSRFGQDIDWVEADVRDRASLLAALEGVDYVIAAAGSVAPSGPDGPRAVDYEGSINFIDAAKDADVKQFVFVSSIGVTHRFHLLNITFGNVLYWKAAAEDYLRASGLTYTIVRPGGLRPGQGGIEGLRVMQGDPKGGSYVLIPDVAELMVATLNNEDAYSKSFEVLSAPQEAHGNWRGVFSSLEPD